MQLLAKDRICVRCLKATIASDPSHICEGVSRIHENGVSSEIATDCHQRCRQRGVNLHHSICLTCIEAKPPRLTNYMKAISARATLRDCVILHRPPPDPNMGSNQRPNPAQPTDHSPPPRICNRPPKEPESKPETDAKEDRHPWTKFNPNIAQSFGQRNKEPRAAPADTTPPRKRTHTPKRVCSPPRPPLPFLNEIRLQKTQKRPERRMSKPPILPDPLSLTTDALVIMDRLLKNLKTLLTMLILMTAAMMILMHVLLPTPTINYLVNPTNPHDSQHSPRGEDSDRLFP